MTAPALRRGGEGAQEAAEQVGGKFVKINYFSLDENKTGFYRFVTDSPDWFYVKQHPSVPTKNKPADFKGNWPQGMPAVCRHDEAFAGIHNDCYVCDTPVMSPHDPTKPLKPAVRVWALAVEREQVVENGVIQGYKNVMEEVPARDSEGKLIEGKTIKQVKVVVVNMGMKNFFSALQGIYGLYGTVCGRDMHIKRTGTGIATDYQIIPMDPIPGHEPGSESWKKYDDAIETQHIDLATIITDRASDEYYARFFDPNKTSAQTAAAATSNGNSGALTAAAQASQAPAQDAPAPAAAVVDQDRLAAMAARVTGTGSNAGTTPPPAEAPAAAPTEAPAPPSGPRNLDD